MPNAPPVGVAQGKSPSLTVVEVNVVVEFLQKVTVSKNVVVFHLVWVLVIGWGVFVFVDVTVPMFR